MNGTQTQSMPGDVSGTPASAGLVAGSVSSTFGAIAAIALAIVGLSGVMPLTLASVATIIVGALILVRGGSRYAVTTQGTPVVETARSAAGRGGDYSADFLGGLGGVVLGILALFGIASQMLIAVAALTYGAALMFGTRSGLSLVHAFASAPAPQAAPIGGPLLAGVATVVLGILAIIGLAPVTLVLAALLILGATSLLHHAAFALRGTGGTQAS